MTETGQIGSSSFLEVGQVVRWRGGRWRVVGEEEGGFVRLAGLDPSNRDIQVTPLLALETDGLEPDALPLPELAVEASDRARWRALHKAFLTTMAGGREQLFGLDWGAITVEPYQLVPLMRVARSVRPRLLVADDTGLGKTAEAGIVLRWLARRHQAKRVLIVTRAAPEPERWRQEMWTKFGFSFDILKSGADFNERRRKSPTVNVFAQQHRLIVSMTLAARQALLDELRQCPAPFDMVIVDEAHHLAERGSRTKRLSVLGRALAASCPDGALLLLTATPHDGKTDSFLSLLRLLDPLVEITPGEVPVDVASRLLVRRLKSEVTLVGGRKLIEPQINVVSTLGDATDEEKGLDGPLDAYLDWLKNEESRYQRAGARQKAKGCQFLAEVYRKRFGSSVAALRATLRRRLELPPAPEDSDDVVPYVDNESSDPEDEVIDSGVGAETPPPPVAKGELSLARALLEVADAVPHGRDSKLEALVRLIKTKIKDDRVVVFTEYRDTLRAAARRLEGEGITFVTFHGGTSDADRQHALRVFATSPDVQVFLATDAASEGKNLQRAAHHLVHLDVPWNPNRYAQRNGRIDRYGQDQRPIVWALVSADRKKGEGRPEYRALELVVEKLRKIEKEAGSVSPILPGFSGGSVSDVLLSADPNAEARLEAMLEGPELERAEKDLSRLAVRNQREIIEAEEYSARLGTTDDFGAEIGELLRTAFRGWDDGGSVESLEDGLVAVNVPARLRAVIGRSKIERATFRREVALIAQEAEDPDAPEFLSPAHPVVEAALRALRDEATDPMFVHRFDVEVGNSEGLVVSFALRFVDGDGRTVEESLQAVEVSLDGGASSSQTRDLERLGLDARGAQASPDPNSVERWRQAWPNLASSARIEAQQRAAKRRAELEEIASRLRDEELGALALWRSEESKSIETLTLGASPQVTFEAAQTYEDRMELLDIEYEERKADLNDKAEVKIGSIDLIGGRLIVEASK